MPTPTDADRERARACIQEARAAVESADLIGHEANEPLILELRIAEALAAEREQALQRLCKAAGTTDAEEALSWAEAFATAPASVSDMIRTGIKAGRGIERAGRELDKFNATDVGKALNEAHEQIMADLQQEHAARVERLVKALRNLMSCVESGMHPIQPGPELAAQLEAARTALRDAGEGEPR